MMHINEIKLDSDDSFSKQFNKCSEYWIKSQDVKLSQDERIHYIGLWQTEKILLELGNY
jgi:hypothetical protein